ncbi:hypothetical protein GQ42DRAFT_39302 [Ramicandelaber brevisporus]|nr:hypothetical protein GQ42DRAFT_39302 [Ramicandelaber brevisporus]
MFEQHSRMAVGRQRTQAAAVAKRPDSGSAAGAGGSIDAIKANAAAAVGGTRTLGVRTRSAAQLAANSVSAAGPVKPATNAAAGTRRNVLGDVSNKGKENVALPLDGKVGKQELALKPASRNTTAAAGPAHCCWCCPTCRIRSIQSPQQK